MRIVFAGTPSAAVPTLNALLASDHEVIAVITRPPARSGRGRSLRPSPVAEAATEAGVRVIEVTNLRGDSIQQTIGALRADLGVVVAFGSIIPPSILELPTHGWVNLHFSDLPRWRGAAPVQWAIRAGDAHTASCVFQLEAGLDTGPVFSRVPFTIHREDAGQLLDLMAEAGGGQVREVVDAVEAGTAQATPQATGGITHARMLTHADGFVDFHSSAAEVDQIIRSVTPNPGAWTTLPNGTRMKIAMVTPTQTPTPGPGALIVTKNSVEVGCADTCLRLDRVAPAGKGWMDGAAWARGARPTPEVRLGLVNENEGDL